MNLRQSFLAALAVLGLAGTGMAGLPAGPDAPFAITTTTDEVIVAADTRDPGNAIVTITAAADTTLGRLNDRKNGAFTGYERATLPPSGSYQVFLSGFSGQGSGHLILTSRGRTTRFTLLADQSGGAVRIGPRIQGDSGMLTVDGDGRSVTVGTQAPGPGPISLSRQTP